MWAFRSVLVLTDVDMHRSPDAHSFMIYNPLLKSLQYERELLVLT